jgi:hypothetical protein
MPEVYPEDYGAHYSDFLYDGDEDVRYDAIFGHGEIDVATGWSQVIEGERHYGGTPTHEAERLLHHSTGPVWFGHVHKPFRHKRRLGFAGSFSRWCQGEEDPKGFDVITMSPLRAGGWRVEASKVVNELAPLYRQVQAEEILDGPESPDEIVAKIREAAGPYQRLRVKFGNYPIGVEDFSIVRGALVEDRNVEIQRGARKAPAPEGGRADPADGEEAAALAEATARLERISYLRDEGVPAPARLHRYIAENSEDPAARGITVEDVAELTAPLA